VWLAFLAALLVPAQLFLRGWGWVASLVVVALDLTWIAALYLFIDGWRSQARFGLGYVRLDEPSFTLGGRLTLHVGGERGLAGLRGVGAWIRCIDAVIEMRDTGGGAERERICYVVWEDARHVAAQDLPARGEVSFQFILPAAGDFAGPVGEHVERYWQAEIVRGGASSFRFRVLVYSPDQAQNGKRSPEVAARTSGTMT